MKIWLSDHTTIKVLTHGQRLALEGSPVRDRQEDILSSVRAFEMWHSEDGGSFTFDHSVGDYWDTAAANLADVGLEGINFHNQCAGWKPFEPFDVASVQGFLQPVNPIPDQAVVDIEE